MDILIIYNPTHDRLHTIYSMDGKLANAKPGDTIRHERQNWVVVTDAGCVQEANRLYREERDWLIEQGKKFASNRMT